MKPVLCLFEDEWYSNLLPLVYLRPVYDLRCGIYTLLEKNRLLFPKHQIVLHARSYLKNVLVERFPDLPINDFSADQILFVNGRAIIEEPILKKIKKMPPEFILKSGAAVVLARLNRENIQKLGAGNSEFLNFDNIALHTEDVGAVLINYPWELVNLNGTEIRKDFRFYKKKKETRRFKSVEFSNKKEIYAGRNVKIDPFVFIDASSGPIVIDDDVRIMSHSSIQGPAYIGKKSIIKMHASIYQDTSIGQMCKVGGEVENSIIHSCSNKQHEGFLGHSYIGSWVNIGASTNNSNLKNNYEEIEININGKPVNTGSRFVGLFMGDHSKTAINTMFNTGTIVGVFCNIFGAGFPKKYLPSFTWGGSEFLRTYQVNKAIEVAKIVMGRRGKILTDAEEELLKHVFEITSQERKG